MTGLFGRAKRILKGGAGHCFAFTIEIQMVSGVKWSGNDEGDGLNWFAAP